MKLYTYWRSSSAYRVRIALGLKGLAYESVFVHLVRAGGEQHGVDFRAKNPLGQVPVLELTIGEKTEVLTQSVAIIEYLEQRFPEPPLLPAEPFARARVRELTELLNSGIQPFQNLSVTAYLNEHAPELDRAAWYQRFVLPGMSQLEERARQLSGRFLVGDAPSMADVFCVPQLYAARRFNIIGHDSFPTLQRIDRACSQLDGFASAHPDRQPDRE